MCLRRFGSASCLVVGVLLPRGGLLAQGPATPDGARPSWVSATVPWLLGQIIPNRLVPDPDPTRRRLVISYDLAPAEFPRRFHRSATYDDAVAALAFLTIGDRDRAAFTLHALARLVRPDGSLWFGYNTANDWPEETDHESAIVRAGAVAWVGYAFVFYLTHAPVCAGDQGCERERASFLQTATRLANYLLSLAVNDPHDPRDGLLRMGQGVLKLAYRAKTDEVVELYRDEPMLAVSTENNISAWFFLRRLAGLTREPRWADAAERIRRGLLQRAWNDSVGQFNQRETCSACCCGGCTKTTCIPSCWSTPCPRANARRCASHTTSMPGSRFAMRSRLPKWKRAWACAARSSLRPSTSRTPRTSGTTHPTWCNGFDSLKRWGPTSARTRSVTASRSSGSQRDLPQ